MDGLLDSDEDDTDDSDDAVDPTGRGQALRGLEACEGARTRAIPLPRAVKSVNAGAGRGVMSLVKYVCVCVFSPKLAPLSPLARVHTTGTARPLSLRVTARSAR